MVIFLFWIGLSVAIGAGADGRGRSGFGWFLLSLFISPLIAFIALILLPSLAASPLPVQVVAAGPESDAKVCPKCAETVKAAATVCRFCRYEFPELMPAAAAQVASAPATAAETVDQGDGVGLALAVALGVLVLIAVGFGVAQNQSTKDIEKRAAAIKAETAKKEFQLYEAERQEKARKEAAATPATAAAPAKPAGPPWRELHSQGVAHFVFMEPAHKRDRTAYDAASKAICGRASAPCEILFWTDREMVATKIPLSDAEVDNQAAQYNRNPNTGFEAFFWSCKVNGNDKKACF